MPDALYGSGRAPVDGKTPVFESVYFRLVTDKKHCMSDIAVFGGALLGLLEQRPPPLYFSAMTRRPKLTLRNQRGAWSNSSSCVPRVDDACRR